MWCNDRLSEARRFRKELGKRFPRRLVAAYREGIDGILGKNRSTYQRAVQLITELKEAGW